MAKLNHHYQKLSTTYLFTEIEKRLAAFKEKNPDKRILNLGVGDAKGPLYPSVSAALIQACQEMGKSETFRGYGPSEGYSFLREAIALGDYKNLHIAADEIFISDGANTDLANLQEIFAIENRVAVPDPAYPVYLDSNVMAGRTRHQLKTGNYGGITYLPCTEENGFQPEPPSSAVDLIYLCSPSNPTGVAMDRELLTRWVQYAKAHDAVILFDGAYEAFVQSPSVPRSIYEIEGAADVAIEIRSFSKMAAFTGLRCSYTVVPRQLKIFDAGALHSLHSLWKRRQDTKFNGVSYPVQKAAAALYTPQGQKDIKAAIRSYANNALSMRQGLQELGYEIFGGIDSPFIWCKTLAKMKSWDFFDYLLETYQIATVPGRGFGLAGEGFVRISCLAPDEVLQEGLSRFKAEKKAFSEAIAMAQL